MTEPIPLDRKLLERYALPPAGGDKDDHGQILVIAGSRDVPGAALLTAHGAMRAGAGKLQIACPDTIAVQLGIAMLEAKVIGQDSHRDGGFAKSAIGEIAKLASRADAIVAGPGLEQNNAAAPLGKALLELGKPMAIDAALLHALPDCEDEVRETEVGPILLPHYGEMASLLGCEPSEVKSDPLAAGRKCAELYRTLLLVKGARSFVVEPGGKAWIYKSDSPGLGVSGSGDVLAGIVGGLLARGSAPLTALLWAVWLHGEAGRELSEKIGRLGFLAREITERVPALLP